MRGRKASVGQEKEETFSFDRACLEKTRTSFSKNMQVFFGKHRDVFSKTNAIFLRRDASQALLYFPDNL